MIKITKAEKKAIMILYPNSKVTTAKHNSFLGGYETDKPYAFIMEQRGFRPKQRHPKKRKPNDKT